MDRPLVQELCRQFPPLKERLLRGLDEIGLTLKQEAAIRAFEARHDPQWRGAP
jgi:3-isopropylmalate dehydratase small subunit